MPLLSSSSVKNKIAEIMIGKPITKDEFLENLNKVLLICTIKAELSDIELELIKDTFRLKYADKLTSNEFLTAFQFNQAGLLPLRVDHYQVFGIEFMTKVLDAYLIERHNVELKNIETQKEIQLNEAERQREISETSQNNMVLKSIINDYSLVSKSIPIELNPFFKLKFSVFNEMAEIDLTDEKIEKINSISIASAIQKRSKRLTEIIYDESKYGEKLNLKREIEQLRNGKWSDKIETELKLIFEFELYKMELALLPEAFCKHVESHLI